MDRDTVIRTLRAHEPELRAAGLVSLAIFGSTARGQERQTSDVDLLATFDRERRLSLLDILGLENWLSDLLGTPVDLVEEGTLKPDLTRIVAREAVVAF